MKLLTLSDGYGDNNVFPHWYQKYWKWPKIIELMTKNLSVINHSRYGAGNEFIVCQLRQQIECADAVIVQWADPKRLDLVLSDQQPGYWEDVIASDAVYKDNILSCSNNKFWLSSGSQTDAVREYHQRYISIKQHQMRSQIYVEYAKLLLTQRQINYRFMLVNNSEYLNVEANWIWHEPFQGMNEFRKHSKYQDLDLGLVQPIPLVAFDFIMQYIMPSIDLGWRCQRDITAVENMLYRHYQDAVKNRNDQI